MRVIRMKDRRTPVPPAPPRHTRPRSVPDTQQATDGKWIVLFAGGQVPRKPRRGGVGRCGGAESRVGRVGNCLPVINSDHPISFERGGRGGDPVASGTGMSQRRLRGGGGALLCGRTYTLATYRSLIPRTSSSSPAPAAVRAVSHRNWLARRNN